MTDVPFGRGGSPLQNLIVRGHEKTVISALKMNEGIDSGPVYMKRELDLAGSALDIFKRTAPVCFEMMHKIQTEEMLPADQEGTSTIYRRRTPSESRIPQSFSITKLYDFVRMLDAPGYPKAFLSYGDLRIDMFNARIDDDETLSAEVKVKKHEK
jgi:methionyl-tRNA formyltransferase